MSFQRAVESLTDSVLKTFGEPAVWTPPDAEPVHLRAIWRPQTVFRGEMGDITDPRPSVQLPVAVVGEKPAGQLQLLGKTYRLGSPLDVGHDGQLVQVFVREVAA